MIEPVEAQLNAIFVRRRVEYLTLLPELNIDEIKQMLIEEGFSKEAVYAWANPINALRVMIPTPSNNTTVTLPQGVTWGSCDSVYLTTTPGMQGDFVIKN